MLFVSDLLRSLIRNLDLLPGMSPAVLAVYAALLHLCRLDGQGGFSLVWAYPDFVQHESVRGMYYVRTKYVAFKSGLSLSGRLLPG